MSSSRKRSHVDGAAGVAISLALANELIERTLGQLVAPLSLVEWAALVLHGSFTIVIFGTGVHIIICASREAKVIRAAPGSRIDTAAEFFFSKRTYEHVLRPVIADLQVEYFDALQRGRPWKARWVRVRGYGAVASTVALQIPISLAKMVFKIWRVSGS